MKTDDLVEAIGQRFRTFGGGNITEGNPISVALKDRPLQFAAGVDVRDVTDFVLEYVKKELGL
ncbi:hypothetical protein LCGC14_2626570 [marine sediment metagenome]|uniref:Uncharacterized protein n=1 Tax=marine sediment metagenome TaxID=412755 RepID=A0A0F9AP50_9ZZZZ